MHRPLRTRVWLTAPQWHWFGWLTLVPFYAGGDEFDWHCWTLGWTITGRITIAVRHCPGTGKCVDEDRTNWPYDHSGHDWRLGEPE